MSEAELIEIEHRYLDLRRLCEDTDLLLAAEEQFLRSASKPVEAERIQTLRHGIDRQLEICREDLQSMQAIIRRKASQQKVMSAGG